MGEERFDLHGAHGRFTGPVLTSGFQDPIYTWATAIVPTGLAVNAGVAFGPSAVGDLFVSGSAGIITRLHPNPTLPPPSTATETVLYRSTASEPADLADLDIRADGFVYTPRVGGIVHRLKSNAGAMGEPSDRGSITPIVLRKTAGNQIEFSVEREAAIEQFGLYSGDLAQSWANFPATSWYTHPAITTDLRSIDAVAGQAYSKFSLDGSTFPSLPYFTFSGLNGRAETVTGYDSGLQVRPGGNQAFGCPCPVGMTVGPSTGNCGPDFTVAQGVEGRTGTTPNVFGPYLVPNDYECSVVLLDLSAEWCPPCRVMAVDSESLYQQFKDRGFVMIHALNEKAPRGTGPCDVPCAERWSSDFNATFPVLADGTSQAWDYYNMINAWPQSLLISRDGMVVRRFDGGQSRATLEAAIDAELSR